MGFIITLGTLRRELNECVIAGSRFPYLTVVGDRELIVEAARVLAQHIPRETEIILGPEFGGAIIAHQLAVETCLPYVVARKRMTPLFGKGISAPVQSAAGTPSNLYIEEQNICTLHSRSVLLIDEVVLSGNTMTALETLAMICRSKVVGKAAIATQGERRTDIIAPLHLPEV